jgi:hypothetical protein
MPGREGCRSFRWSFRHARHDMTGTHQLDDAPDLSSANNTNQHGADGCGLTSNP